MHCVLRVPGMNFCFHFPVMLNLSWHASYPNLKTDTIKIGYIDRHLLVYEDISVKKGGGSMNLRKISAHFSLHSPRRLKWANIFQLSSDFLHVKGPFDVCSKN